MSVTDKRKDITMGINLNENEERNYQCFIKDLEKISKKYGIGLNACGCFDFYDEDGFQNITYKRDSSSGDLVIEELTFSDGTKLDR